MIVDQVNGHGEWVPVPRVRRAVTQLAFTGLHRYDGCIPGRNTYRAKCSCGWRGHYQLTKAAALTTWRRHHAAPAGKASVYR